VLYQPGVLTAVSHVVTTSLFTTTVALSLLARSGLPGGTLKPVAPGGSHDYLSILILVALAAGSLPLHFLLASSNCCPSPVWTYICAVSSHTGHFTLKMEAACTSGMFLCYCNTTWCHKEEYVDFRVSCFITYQTLKDYLKKYSCKGHPNLVALLMY
jgi:hypothetical protein